MKNTPVILIHPGWQDSGPEHWQSLWLKKYPNAVKVEQKDWMFPRKDEWVSILNDAINQHLEEEIILVGHSLACATIAHWAQVFGPTSKAKIKGALLVSPFQRFPKEMTGFAPLPLSPLPFKAIVVASETDPWATIEEAKNFADAWGAELVNIGHHGHINTAAGFGEWPEGERILARLQ